MKLLDGAMGTRLIARGVAPADVWRAPIDHPALVAEIHRSYPRAEAITAATFGLSAHADHPDTPRIAQAALRLARDVAASRPVIASLGPGRPDAVAHLLADADVLLLETFTRLDALKHALEHCPFDGPRWATLCFLGEHTSDGAPPEAARDLDADAIGVNCGADAGSARLAVRMLGALPVLARPTAGTDTPVPPSELAALARELWDRGVSWIGGCCAAHAEHIDALADVAGELARE